MHCNGTLSGASATHDGCRKIVDSRYEYLGSCSKNLAVFWREIMAGKSVSDRLKNSNRPRRTNGSNGDGDTNDMKIHEALAVGVVALLVRVLVSIHKFSGAGVRPMHGDFEAQRHWKELTVNLRMGDWYRQTTSNDLLYWGLDYPPLTAYHSYVMGKIAEVVYPKMVALRASRGLEDVHTVAFMRWSVLVADMLVFIPAAIAAYQYCRGQKRDSQGKSPSAASPFLWLVLLCPSLLIIDHGHFQYNGISLGLVLLAFMFILQGKSVLGSICFCLSLNYKQMSLHLAPAFFFFLLKQCFDKSNGKLHTAVKHVLLLGVTVITTFAVLWLPFCVFHAPNETCASSLMHIVTRVFPFNRGIFEDKVSNLWYTLSVVYDYRDVFSQRQLSIFSMGLTLTMLAPMATDLLRRGTEIASHKRFLLALTNSALAFFLASFQVHEKSLLLALVPASLLMQHDPLVVGWFQLLGMFSMYPLLARDQLQIPYVALSCLFVALWLLALPADGQSLPSDLTDKRLRWWMKAFMIVFTLVALSLQLGYAFIPPPARYPDLYPALISMLSAGGLSVLFIYTSIWQWSVQEPPKSTVNIPLPSCASS